MSIKSLIIILLVAPILFVACGERDEASETDMADERVLDFVTTVTFLDQNENEITEIRAAIADDDRTRSEGLMNVTNLPNDAGMVFYFDNEQPRSFYMANTPLSLDIIFVNAAYQIVRIHRNTTPFSSATIPSEAPAKYVVEVNAGYTLSNDINEGDFIRLGDR